MSQDLDCHGLTDVLSHRSPGGAKKIREDHVMTVSIPAII
jgi:hypothetical protein